MRKGAVLCVVGVVLALAGGAQASLHQRERAAITAYALSQHGAASDCRPWGRRHRQLACLVSIALYLEPSHTLFATDSATIVAFQEWDGIYMVRAGSWSR